MSRTRPVSRVAPAGLRHDDLRGDVGSSRSRRASINLGQGFPDTDGPPEVVSRPRSTRSATGHNQYPPGIGVPDAAPRDRGAPAAFLRPRLRPRHRGARHRRRDRGDRGRADRAVRAGRRGRHVRAVLRLVRGVHRDGRRDAARRARCSPPDYSFDPDALARRDHAAHAAHPAQLAAQPHRQGASPRRARRSIAELVRRARPASP